MRAILISTGKILAFLGLWALLLGGVVMVAVQGGGEDWFAIVQWRLWMEIGGAVVRIASGADAATIAAVIQAVKAQS